MGVHFGVQIRVHDGTDYIIYRKGELMTLNEFIKTIKESGDMREGAYEIAFELCKCSNISHNKHTVDSWMKGQRKPSLEGVVINVDGFMQFFNTHTKSTWEKMQREFGKKDEYGLIDCNTENSEIFYRSLLALLYEIFRYVPATLQHILPEKPLLFGRKNELDNIEEIFRASNYAVLTGIGGIGKSQLALAYAHKLNTSSNWIIQHVICEESDNLRRTVNKLLFDDFTESKGKSDKETFDYRVDLLKNSPKPAFIILDNLNQPFTSTDRDDFKKLIGCGHHVRLLITSRNSLVHKKEYVIDVPPLDNDTLLNLYTYHRFEDFADHSKYITGHKEVLDKIFTLVEKHTLMITLIAKLPNSILLDELAIYKRLESDLNLPMANVNLAKDGTNIEGTLMEITKKIFNVAQLTDDEKTIMKNMSVMPLMGVEPALFEELTGYTSMNLTGLIRNHWIIKDEETFKIRLHPLICESILNLIIAEVCENSDLLQHVEDLVFTKYIDTKLSKETKYNSRWHTLNKIKISYLSKIYFPIMVQYNPMFKMNKGYLIDYLKDEYKDALFLLNRYAKKYANADLPKSNDQIGDN